MVLVSTTPASIRTPNQSGDDKGADYDTRKQTGNETLARESIG
jgi:hypothetical protein